VVVTLDLAQLVAAVAAAMLPQIQAQLAPLSEQIAAAIAREAELRAAVKAAGEALTRVG
jgi:hypothetical protein